MAPNAETKKTEKNPFLSTPVPDTFRPSKPLGPLPSVHPPPLRAPNALLTTATTRFNPSHTATLRDTIDAVDTSGTIDTDPIGAGPIIAAPIQQNQVDQALTNVPASVVRAFPYAHTPYRATPTSSNTQQIQPVSAAPWPVPSRATSTFTRNTLSPTVSITEPKTAPKSLSHTLTEHTITTATLRAIAVAHERSNAVGTVDLSCTAAGLVVQFVRISAYTDGYVPYPATSSERVVVPYEKVARVQVDDDGLVHLDLDPTCTPYNRLVLAGLARDRNFDHAMSHRRRQRIAHRVTIAALVAWIPLAMMLRWMMPNLAAILVMAMSACVSIALYFTREHIATKLVLFGSATQQVRDELISELRYRLSPGKVQIGWNAAGALSQQPSATAQPSALGEPDEVQGGSLRGLFATAGLVAAAAAVAILVGKNLLFSSEQPQHAWGSDLQEAWEFARSEPVSNAGQQPSKQIVQPAISADPTPVIVPAPACTCDRADSPLWIGGIDRMTILSSNRPGTTSPERPSVYPEIAIVNNSATDLRDIVMVVDFLHGGADGQKPRIVDKQDLFWEGVLAPGKAVKWRVRGRGDDFTVTSFVTGQLGDSGIEPAPADAFYKLAMTANTPSVRVHGTKMLAYLGDPRVTEGLDKLRSEPQSGQSEEQAEQLATTLDQIATAARPLRVCSTIVEKSLQNPQQFVVKACVFNAGDTPIDQSLITAQANFNDNVVHNRWTLTDKLAPHSGVITKGTVQLPWDNADAAHMMMTVIAEQ